MAPCTCLLFLLFCPDPTKIWLDCPFCVLLFCGCQVHFLLHFPLFCWGITTASTISMRNFQLRWTSLLLRLAPCETSADFLGVSKPTLSNLFSFLWISDSVYSSCNRLSSIFYQYFICGYIPAWKTLPLNGFFLFMNIKPQPTCSNNLLNR